MDVADVKRYTHAPFVIVLPELAYISETILNVCAALAVPYEPQALILKTVACNDANNMNIENKKAYLM